MAAEAPDYRDAWIARASKVLENIEMIYADFPRGDYAFCPYCHAETSAGLARKGLIVHKDSCELNKVMKSKP